MRARKMFASFLLGALGACGGGSGNQGHEPTLDERVATAMKHMLDTASTDPRAALLEYQEVLSSAYEESTELDTTSLQLALATVRALGNEGAWPKLLTLCANTPEQVTGIAVHSTAAPSRCGETRVYFINGIRTLPPEAYQATNRLARLFYAQYPGLSGNIGFSPFYNRSGLFDPQLPGVCETLSFGTGVYGLVGGSIQVLADLWSSIRGACGSLADLVESANLWAAAMVGLVPTEPEVRVLVDIIENDVREGNTVILVAHSAGNLFAQHALRLLSIDSYGPLASSVGVVAIASPTFYSSTPHGAFHHYKLHGDILDQVLAGGLTFGLQANIDNDLSMQRPAVKSIDIHSILMSYLWYPQSRDSILAAIAAQAGALLNPRCKPLDPALLVGTWRLTQFGTFPVPGPSPACINDSLQPNPDQDMGAGTLVVQPDGRYVFIRPISDTGRPQADLGWTGQFNMSNPELFPEMEYSGLPNHSPTSGQCTDSSMTVTVAAGWDVGYGPNSTTWGSTNFARLRPDGSELVLAGYFRLTR